MGFWASGRKTPAPKSTGQFFLMATFCIAFYESNLSTLGSKGIVSRDKYFFKVLKIK
jgi:hypothetical protein